MPPRTGKITSALSAYESNIQKNAESGEHSGMYISNIVGKKGGLGKSNHGRSHSTSQTPTRRREGSRPVGRSDSRSPSRQRPGRSTSRSPSRAREPSRTREASRVRGGARSTSASPPRNRSGDAGRARSASRSPSRHRNGVGNGSRSASRSPLRHNRSGNRSASRSPSRHRPTNKGNRSSLSKSPPQQCEGPKRQPRPDVRGSPAKTPPVNEARKAAEKFKKRAEKMNGQPRRKERPSSTDQFDDARPFDANLSQDGNMVTATLRLDSTEKRGKSASDRSARTDTTGEMTLDDVEKSGTFPGWKSFDESANFFSEAEDSTGRGGDEDDFSLISESSFQQPDWNPDASQKKKKKDPNASWASGFAVSYHQRDEDTDSESDVGEGQRRLKKERPRKPSQRPLQKTGSSRKLKKKADDFAVTYQHRTEESDSDFDTEDMTEKIRRKQLSKNQSLSSSSHHKSGSQKHAPKTSCGFAVTYQHRTEDSDSDFVPENARDNIQKKQILKSGSSHSLQRTASFKLSRTTSAHSLGNENGGEDLNNLSCRSLNSRALRAVSHRQVATGSGDFFNNLVVGEPSSSNGSFLGSASSFGFESDNEKEPSFESHRQSQNRNAKIQPTLSRNDGEWSDVNTLSSGPKPKPTRPARNYGAAVAAENLTNLPPAFQTIARKQMSEGHVKRQNPSSRPSDRKPKKETSEVHSHHEEDGALYFGTDRSFFECV